MELSKNFEPGSIEQKWTSHWKSKRYFNSTPDGRKAFTVVIPPPNVTGVLHMGHTLNETVQDILVRKARMSGFNACWVPGSDHASIATEAKVVQMLKEKGIDKNKIGREEFLKRPDIINGVIAMSGVYDLTEYTKGHYDDDVYFNSPMHYMPNLTDHNVLEQIRRTHHLHIFTGSGAYEDPTSSGRFARILYDKAINYELDVWGKEWPHDWNTWRAVLPHYLETRF